MPTREDTIERVPVQENVAERVHLQTLRRCYTAIRKGEDPWIPLGMFMHQFFGTYWHLRQELLRSPICLPKTPTPLQFQWAVFCAASAEYLSNKYGLACPTWALAPRYRLDEPWFHGINVELLEVQEELRTSTPEAFARRNVFCGDRVYSNKYEYQGRRGQRKIA